MVPFGHKYNYLPLSLQVYNRYSASIGRIEIGYEKIKHRANHIMPDNKKEDREC